MNALRETNFELSGQTNFYRGKVRDVYTIDDELLIMIASDRISAFDVVLPKGIPGKGQVLNQTANHFLNLTQDIVPNWKISTPDPMVTIGKKAQPLMVEMVIRGYLSGHAWREYRDGKREICGVKMPDGMKESDAFPEPILTPSTKAEQGDHDQDISREEILKRKIVSEDNYVLLENYTRALFERGQSYAGQRGLILVDTKYEFGKASDGSIVLIDEIHTPDSSRYFYLDGYEERQKTGEAQKQLSKEFVRQWLIQEGFQGKPGQQIPEMPQKFIEKVTNRYIELYESITGQTFNRHNSSNLKERIFANIEDKLKQLR